MPERKKLKVSTRVMYDEFVRQNASIKIVDADSSILEYNDNSGVSHLLFSTSSDKSSNAGALIARNKIRSEIVARDLFIPVPKDCVCASIEEVIDFFSHHDAIVLKPLDNSGGNGVSTNITNIPMLKAAYAYAREYGDQVIAQQHISGTDIRLLVIAGTFRSAVERRPASVTGNGILTIRELIERENASPDRSDNYMTTLSYINMGSAHRYLADAIETIPMDTSVVSVVGPANLSLGGTAHEATNLVSQQMIDDAEKIARRLSLGICGVDMMWDKKTNEYYMIEVNATPGIDMHNDQFWGTSTLAIEQYVTWLLDPSALMQA